MTTTLNRAAGAAALFLVGVTACLAAEPATGAVTGGIAPYVVARGDTLFSIGARLGVDVETLAADNGLDRRQVLAVGQRLTVDNRHIIATDAAAADIVVNLPQRMLFFFERETVGLPVAVGRRTWPTPTSEFRVASRETDPTWDVPASIRDEARRLGRSLPASVPPGPTNPLGRFWIGLAGGGAIGLHGTNAPSSIYGAVTHGCMRLSPDDIAWLFPRVQIGMTVRTVYEPVLLADVDGQVFLEVHPDVYRRAPISLASVRARATERGLAGRIDWTRAARAVALQHGIARDVTARRIGGDEGVGR